MRLPRLGGEGGIDLERFAHRDLETVGVDGGATTLGDQFWEALFSKVTAEDLDVGEVLPRELHEPSTGSVRPVIVSWTVSVIAHPGVQDDDESDGDP